MAGTLGDMKARIASELARGDLTTHFPTAAVGKSNHPVDTHLPHDTHEQKEIDPCP